MTQTTVPGVGTLWKRTRECLRAGLRWYNRRLSHVYSPGLSAFTCAALVLVVALVLLFIPPIVGTADDGSLSGVLLNSGLGYRRQDLENPSGAYFVRLYLHSTYQPQGLSAQRILIRTAIRLDNLFTHDNLFDIRFLAFLYLLLYLPAVVLVTWGIASRAKNASEATFLAILCALVFGDADVLAYFNSLYPEAMWHIFRSYCIGFCLMLQHRRSVWNQLSFIGLIMMGGILVMTEAHCASVGVVLVGFCLRQVLMEQAEHDTKLLALVAAVALLVLSTLSIGVGASRFDENSKLHAMTNGVLMRSTNPEETLREFGIDPRFETLADCSAFDDYPYTLVGQADIQRNFLPKYNTAFILLYYLRHPMEFSGIMELAVRCAFQTARSFVGNYEWETGLPARARNPFMILYSNFKANSLPRTMGFLFILTLIYFILFRRRRASLKKPDWTPRERQIMLDTFLCTLLMGLADLGTVICMSGTAELERYQTLCGGCIDILLLLFVAEILHRLNILSNEE